MYLFIYSINGAASYLDDIMLSNIFVYLFYPSKSYSSFNVTSFDSLNSGSTDFSDLYNFLNFFGFFGVKHNESRKRRVKSPTIDRSGIV